MFRIAEHFINLLELFLIVMCNRPTSPMLIYINYKVFWYVKLLNVFFHVRNMTPILINYLLFRSQTLPIQCYHLLPAINPSLTFENPIARARSMHNSTSITQPVNRFTPTRSTCCDVYVYRARRYNIRHAYYSSGNLNYRGLLSADITMKNCPTIAAVAVSLYTWFYWRGWSKVFGG